MKVINKLAFIVAMIVISMLVIGTVSSATDSQWLTPPSAQSSSLIKPTQDIIGQILSIVQVIGVSVAVVMLIVLGIKYMSSAPNDRAEIKKHAVVYVVGAVVLFAASGIVGLIRGFSKTLGYTVTTTSDGTREYRDSDGKLQRTESSDGYVTEYDFDAGTYTMTRPDGTVMGTYNIP